MRREVLRAKSSHRRDRYASDAVGAVVPDPSAAVGRGHDGSIQLPDGVAEMGRKEQRSGRGGHE
jgi:hypothetical protein